MDLKLKHFFMFIIIFPSISHCGGNNSSAGGICIGYPGMERTLTVSVDQKRDQTNGEWVRTFSAESEDTEKIPKDITLAAKHVKSECDGKHVVRIQMAVREADENQSSTMTSEKKNVLRFHKRHGKNVIVVNDGITAQKLDMGDLYNAVVFTNRPLKNNELFEIRLEKKIRKTNHALGFGVINVSPDDVEILPEMHYRNQTWIWHHNNIYQSKKLILSGYGRNLDEIEVNDRIAVTRREDGELHFFLNGVSIGPAATGVPENIYGVLELWHDANKATIIHPCQL